MKIEISQQKFSGKVVNLLGELDSGHQKKALIKSLPKMNEIINKQDFDLFIKRTAFNETIVGTDINSGYIVNSDNDFLLSALLAIRDKKKGSYMQRKLNAIKEAMSEII